MSDALPEGVSIYDRLVWPEGALEHYLATGERRRELIAYLGEAEYAVLGPLARTAAALRPDTQRTVWLVPGIMGSQLGVPRAAPLPDNLLWIDPVDFQHGGLLELALENEDVRSCGPVIHSYLRLKLALAAHGHAVRCFDYDWRHGVRELGRRLAERLKSAGNRSVLVCHSMGGLVARAALELAPDHIERIVTLGTPHLGAYSPLQALRGVYGTVRRLAQLDPLHSAEELATRVFSGFPSLYDMLPRDSTVDWLDAGNWPSSEPRPRNDELKESARLRLPLDPERLFCIAGTGQPTVTAAFAEGDELRYHVTAQGDGTVPASSAALAGHACRYVELSHSELPRDPRVAAAVLDVLATGGTSRLTEKPRQPALPMPPIEVTDGELRALFTTKLDWAKLSAEDRRAWLDSLNAPLVPLT
ncbi:MAG: alpha/beta hydrolase [Steroidobacteraceae bacterium]